MMRNLTLDTLAQRLGTLPLMLGLDAAVLLKIARTVEVREVRKRDLVMRKGTAGEHLFFLLEGRLQVLDITEGGREIGLNFLNAGDYLGELSVIDGQERSASVVAIEPSTVVMLPRAHALDLFHNHALVAQRILSGLTRQIRNASRYQMILCLPSAPQRVYALLQNMSRVAPGGLIVIDYAPKHHELAIMVNTSRETVSRTVKRLLRDGVIEKDHKRWIVRNPEMLNGLARRDTNYHNDVGQLGVTVGEDE